MSNRWEKGEFEVQVRAWYDYPNDTDDIGPNYVEITIGEAEGRIVLINWFRIWATRPHEIEVYNEVLWTQLAKEVYPNLIYDYPYLKGVKCEECCIEIYRGDDLFAQVEIPEDKLVHVEFR